MKALLFHEMVHVVQYEVLGIETFVTRYVHGWFGQGYMCKSRLKTTLSVASKISVGDVNRIFCKGRGPVEEPRVLIGLEAAVCAVPVVLP